MASGKVDGAYRKVYGAVQIGNWQWKQITLEEDVSKCKALVFIDEDGRAFILPNIDGSFKTASGARNAMWAQAYARNYDPSTLKIEVYTSHWTSSTNSGNFFLSAIYAMY